MKIFITDIIGNVIILECDSTDTIHRIKDKVHDVEGKPPDLQRLIFRGQQLEDYKTLADYSIHNECTIHVVYRLKGCGPGEIERPPLRPEKSDIRCADPSNFGWGEEHGVKLLNLVLRCCQAGDMKGGNMTDEAWLWIKNSLNGSMNCNFQIDFLRARLRDYLQLYSLLAGKCSPIIDWDREKKIVRLWDDYVNSMEVHPELLLLCGEYIPYFQTLEEVSSLLNTKRSQEQQVATSSRNTNNERPTDHGVPQLSNNESKSQGSQRRKKPVFWCPP